MQTRKRCTLKSVYEWKLNQQVKSNTNKSTAKKRLFFSPILINSSTNFGFDFWLRRISHKKPTQRPHTQRQKWQVSYRMVISVVCLRSSWAKVCNVPSWSHWMSTQFQKDYQQTKLHWNQNRKFVCVLLCECDQLSLLFCFFLHLQSISEFLKNLPCHNEQNFALYNTENGIRTSSRRPSVYLPTVDIPSEQSMYYTQIIEFIFRQFFST